ncbi:MAG: XRE family transcriptional regulator [Actinobacteria bacterium]|nr:XRE family transcriptional regulator [Actinomycetota bacterium]
MTSLNDRVRRLIEASGLSQGQFAEAVGLDAPKLSKSLSGVRRFSSLDLARIAEHAGRTVDWLLTGEEPPLALAARAAAGSPTSAATQAAYELVSIRAGVASFGFLQPWAPPSVPPLRGTDVKQGANLAEVALAHLRAQDISVVDDLAGAIEQGFGADVAIVPLGDGVDGLAASTETAKIILAATTATPYRQRFTIAHELGHLLVGDDQEVHVDRDIFGPESKTAGTERRANAFAAAFLMPEVELRAAVPAGRIDEAGFCALAVSLQVSPSALAYRLKGLDLIDGMAQARLGGLSAKHAAAKTGATAALVAQASAAAAMRPPALLTRDAFAAFEQGHTTIRPYARLLGQDDTDRLLADLAGAGSPEGSSDGASPETTRQRRRTTVAAIRSFFDEDEAVES